MGYMNENNTDDYYKILYKARYYYTQMNVMSPERFYKLIKKLEDVRWNGSIIQPVEFKYYFPSYALMEKEQFQYYIYWRTYALEGNVMPCDASYFYVFIYELLTGVHASSKEGVYHILINTFKEYRNFDKKVEKYLIPWILAYCIINGMFIEKKKELDELASGNFEIWNQDYKILNNDYNNCFDAVMRSSAYKLDKKSNFYLSRKDARIIDEVFDKVFYAISDCMKAHNLVLSEFIVGKKSKVRWRIYQSTPWEGKLFLFTDKIQYQHSFNFAGVNYEYNSKEHTWDKDEISKEGKISGGQMVSGRIYLYHNGEFIAYLVKVIENICRKKAEYKRALKPNYTKEYGTLRLNELVQSGEIERIVEDVMQNHIETVGIITPYAAQVRLIRAMLKDYYTKGTTNVSCATVHQFQGSESDVIVFDAVESYPKSAVGYLMGKEPNQVARLINVAITRGKGKVITVANARFWENVFKGTNHIFYKLLQHIKNGKHQVIDNHDKTLQPYFESVNLGRMINIFMNEQDAISMFEQDMKKAKWQTVVSLPSGELRETEHQVFEIIDEADSRGVDIKMKSNDYAKLPEQWKEYCVGTENATFPLIIIDDEVVWYGLPTAKWKFQVDKTTSMITVVHSMVRIKGKNTVEMIKALTDIETVIVGQNIRKLDNKKSKLVTNSFAASSGNSEDNGSILNYGLGAFVEEKEFCPKCKNHMILAKNARGTAYLKCSNKACKETKYLTVDLMNWYINSHNIKCPKRDGGELKGGLGKYGPYVRCNCGHFLKPDEI